MKYPCGFYAVNNKHCWINGRCVVCKEEQAPVSIPVIAYDLIRETESLGDYYPNLGPNEVVEECGSKRRIYRVKIINGGKNSEVK